MILLEGNTGDNIPEKKIENAGYDECLESDLWMEYR